MSSSSKIFLSVLLTTVSINELRGFFGFGKDTSERCRFSFSLASKSIRYRDYRFDVIHFSQGL